MHNKGIIFDFNGTLFWDSAFHDEAWKNFSLKYSGKILSDDDLKENVHGRINPDILTFVFGRKLPIEEALKFASEKEAIYRQTISAKTGLHKLAAGAIEFLDFLKKKNLPFTIATSANKENVDFYFELLNLDKWFDYSKVIYEELVSHPKPHPEIFINAAANLNKAVEDCIVIEDSVTGLQAAKNANIGEIIFIENDLPVSYEKVKSICDKKINNFFELIPQG